jgi:hypothetical protein
VFDIPGAGTGPGQGTVPFCNNPVDAITGWEIDANGVFHGSLRIPVRKLCAQCGDGNLLL